MGNNYIPNNVINVLKQTTVCVSNTNKFKILFETNLYSRTVPSKPHSRVYYSVGFYEIYYNNNYFHSVIIGCY